MKTATERDSPEFLKLKRKKLSIIFDTLSSECKSKTELNFNFLHRLVGLKDDPDLVSSHNYDEEALSLINQFEDGLILDCGAGLRNDYYDNVVNFEIKPYPSTDVIGMGENLPFKNNSFDAVLSLNVLEHVKDPFACAKEISRVLKPGGKLYCVAAFMQPFHAYPSHYFNMTPEGMTLLFEDQLEIDLRKVLPSGHPIFSLTWYLQSWVRALPEKTAQEFLDLTVRHLIQNPIDLLNKNYVQELSKEATQELAATTAIFATKAECEARQNDIISIKENLGKEESENLRFLFHSKLHTWCIDDVRKDEDRITISGWINLSRSEKEALCFYCNGKTSESIELNLQRSDLRELFPFWKDANIAGFSAVFQNIQAEEFSFAYNTCNRYEKYGLTKIYFPNLLEKIGFPEAIDRQRVHGHPGLIGFQIEGFSAYKKICWILENEFNLELNKDLSLLDWGSGCGRMARYFVNSEISLTCADIDQRNLEWCESNLGFKTILLSEETEGLLGVNRFDVVIGISVLSHLDQAYQIKWLFELAKSLKPNGCAILSTHGVCSALRRLSNGEFSQFLGDGFWDAGPNQSLADVDAQNNSYKDTYTSLNFIVSNWLQDFELVKVYEAVIGNHQDLVILKKR